jgi:hypothetical protein
MAGLIESLDAFNRKERFCGAVRPPGNALSAAPVIPRTTVQESRFGNLVNTCINVAILLGTVAAIVTAVVAFRATSG